MTIDASSLGNLLNYGVLGMWTTQLLYEKYRMGKKQIETTEKHTKAINRNTKILEKLYQFHKT